MTGTLYVVATPIGNLDDLTVRAREVLHAVPLVAAEDTRRTRALLSHIDAHPSIRSYHAHSKPSVGESLIATLQNGTDIALVSDAGTPAISDPGAALVRAAGEVGIPVVPIPGANAVAVALSAAGLGADRYLFLGFLPRRGRERRALLDQVKHSQWTAVLFEAPQRLGQLLDDLLSQLDPNRQVVVAREVTKRYEEFRRGTLSDLAGYYGDAAVRGEVTVMVEGAGRHAQVAGRAPEATVRERAVALLRDGTTRRDTAAIIERECGWTRNDAYQFVSKL